MGKSRQSANLVSDNNIFVNVTNDRVGIGSTTPKAKLDVIGNVNVSGVVTATTFSGSGASLTAIPISTGISGLGANVATFLATPTSANLISAVSDETGSGNLVFSTNPTLIGPSLGNANATNISISGVGTITTLNATGAAVTASRSTWEQVGLGLTFTTGIATNFTVSGVGTVTQLVSTNTRVSGALTATEIDTTWQSVGLGLTFTTGIGTNFTVSGVGTVTQLVSTNISVSGISSVGTGVTIVSTGDARYAGIITAVSFVGNLTGTATNAQGLTGTPNINVGIVTATNLNIIGISTSVDTRFQSVGEKTARISGNTASLVYNTGGGNIAICTNPTDNITLAVTGIPTDASFNDTSITFSVFIIQTGTARSCTAVTLNGFNATIRWPGGSLASATAGVTTTNGMDIYSFTGINTVGSANTTANYYVLGVVNGGYR